MTEHEDRSSEETQDSTVGDTFFRHYEDRFEGDFRRAYRDVTKRDNEEQGISLDPRSLYRALFLPQPDVDSRDAVRESFRALAESTEEAEAVLKRTWMIMATNFIDYRMKNGRDPEDVSALQEMLEEYSALLNDVYLDMSRNVELEFPEIDCAAENYKQVVERFREYMLEKCPQEHKELLRIFTCFRGIPVDSSAEVIKASDFEVTFRVSPTQAAILRRMGLALIESPLHAMAYRAYSTRVDPGACEVTFSHFIEHDEPMERRHHHRVEPERPVEASIRKGADEFTGMLVDVSAVAAAVFLRNVNLDPLNEGDEVELNVWLPRLSTSGELHLSIPARISKVRSSVKEDPNAHRVVLNIPGDKRVFDQICRYIVDAQEKSLRESTSAELSD
jgi:hypothetical protein